MAWPPSLPYPAQSSTWSRPDSAVSRSSAARAVPTGPAKGVAPPAAPPSRRSSSRLSRRSAPSSMSIAEPPSPPGVSSREDPTAAGGVGSIRLVEEPVEPQAARALAAAGLPADAEPDDDAPVGRARPLVRLEDAGPGARHLLLVDEVRLGGRTVETPAGQHGARVDL